MSGLLAGKVWLSALDPDLKPLAATLADIADDDGGKLFPSVAYVCWRLGRSERAVQMQLKKLREMGVLVKVRQGGGKKPDGWGRVCEYRLVECSLPKRPPWRGLLTNKKGATVAPYESSKGQSTTAIGCSLQQDRVQPTAPNPLVRTVKEKEPPGATMKIRNASEFFKRVKTRVKANGLNRQTADTWLELLLRLNRLERGFAIIEVPSKTLIHECPDSVTSAIIRAFADCGQSIRGVKLEVAS